MLRGRPPFDWEAADTDEASVALVRKVRAGALPFDDEDEAGAPRAPPSEACLALLYQMTRAEPGERPTAAAVLANRWLASPRTEAATAVLDAALPRLAI